MKLIDRPELLDRIQSRFRTNPVVLLLGPRQCGKTTLARQFVKGRNAEYFDLESPADFRRLEEPMTALEPLREWVVIDEAQLKPELFGVLRVLADRRPVRTRFLLLGSASPELVKGSAESLAGRVALLPVSGFDLSETGQRAMRQLWWRGSFPRSFLARSNATSRQWRADFIQTFLERDLRRMGVQVPANTLRRFWNMVTHYHGQIWNASEIGRSLGESHTTVRRHLDILCDSFVMRQLPPWYENIGKRQIKSPKVYLRDTGLLHELLGIDSFSSLESHPKLGASWEGFALEQALRVTGDREAYFWHTQGGAELDLMLFINGNRYGLEFKYADAPSVTKSLNVAKEDLKLKHVFIVHPGSQSYPLNQWAESLSIVKMKEKLQHLINPCDLK
jgi:predicted AAA+ superfamily ATPase